MGSKFNPETKIWKGVDVPYPFPLDLHVNKLVIDGLKKTPERIVQVSYDDGSEMTCEELRLKIVSAAQNLAKLGIKENDVVVTVCANSMDLMTYVNGIVQLGAIINPMSVEHSSADLAHMFKQTKPKLVICDAEVYEKTRKVLNEIKNDSPIYTTLAKVRGVPFADDLFKLTGEEENYQPPTFKNVPRMTLAILTSSGSTGPGKGVCMSQTFFLKTAISSPAEPGRSITFSPIIWGSAFGSLIMATMTLETRIVTDKAFTPEIFFDITTKHKATHWLMNPPKLTQILKSPLVKTVDKSNVLMILSLGGIVNEQMRENFKKEFPDVHFMIFYGLTEVSCTMTFPGQPIDGLTVGYVYPNTQIKIVDDDGKALGPGEIGEFYTKFSICDFLGYYNDPEATEEALDEDLFIKTGDLGYIDEKGFAFVIDRKKEIFKYKGHHINPSEIENVIDGIEGVAFAVVVGIPNPETYNLIAAVIQKKPGYEDLKEQDVVDIVADKLPPYKQLSGGAFFLEKLPMTATGKILKRETKQIAAKLFNDKQNSQ